MRHACHRKSCPFPLILKNYYPLSGIATSETAMPCQAEFFPRLTKVRAQLQNGLQPVKRKRALLASNPPRNSRWENSGKKSTMTNRQFGEAKLTKWTIISFLLGTCFGSGAVWQLLHARVEAQKQELDMVSVTTELRQKEIDLYDEIISLTNEYVSTGDQYSKNPSVAALHNKLLQIQSRLGVMKDAFTVLENKLAHLEGRQPRKINLIFVPPNPPTGISLTIR